MFHHTKIPPLKAIRDIGCHLLRVLSCLLLFMLANLSAPVSAGEESAGSGHLVAVLSVSADAEGNSSNANNECAHDGSVGPPVARLGVPTTSGGPDFLGVRDLSTSTHCDRDVTEGVLGE